MKRSFVGAALAVVVCGGALAAQTPNPNCPAGGAVSVERASQDACQMAVDVFNYMNPQLGTIIAGGNATLGQGGTLGGPGHFVVGVRANALAGSLPNLPSPRTSGASPARDFATDTKVLPMPTVDAALGIFKGLPLGLTNVGGVDLLLSASYLPEFSGNNIDVKVPNGPLKIGYGARVGLLQESLLVPGISVSFLKRDLPTVDISASAGGADLNVRSLDVKTTAWRVTASKNLLAFGLAAGVGQDRYSSSANISASGTLGAVTVNTAPFDLTQKMTRTNYFADVYMNLLLAKLVAEVGMVSGGTASTYNTLDKAADASRLYGSVGLRVGL